MRQIHALMSAAVIPALAVPAFGLEPLQTKGTIDAVTVYRGQALVTRLIDVPGPAGLREVVVTDLPDRTVIGSVFAESADGIEVRSVRFRQRAVTHDVREEVRQLDAEITVVKDSIAANERHQAVAAKRQAYLARLESFTTETVGVELNRGVLDAGTLKELSEYVFENWAALAETELNLAREHRDLADQLDLLQRKRSHLTSGQDRTVREAVVFVEIPADQGGRLRLRYMVDHANWWPSYNVRTDRQRDGVLVEYNAAIQQMSGESWADVEMTLSTATPSLAAAAPALAPLQVGLTLPAPKVPAGQGGKDSFADAKQSLRHRRVELQNAWNFDAVIAANGRQQQALDQFDEQFRERSVALDFGLNDLAAEYQKLEITSRGLEGNPGGGGGSADEGISVTYRLASRITLPSRSDQQSIRIASLPMDAEFYRVAAPVLTDFVYEEASLSNRSDLVLLAGPVTAYIEGEFVGQGQLPTVAVGEPLSIGFGIDSSLRAKRTLVKREERIQGGNRVIDFTYALGIENFGNQPVAVRLRDRLPQPRGSEIKVTLVDTGLELSDDPVYRATGHKQNILRWDIEVPATTSGVNTETIEYRYQLEFDKEMAVG